MIDNSVVMNNEFLMSAESQLSTLYPQTIQPFWQQCVTQGSFVGFDDITIAYAYVLHPQAIGSIVISTGRIESYIKYRELVYDLYQNGYSVFIHDHRGQGLSGRMTENRHMGYVNDFADYVHDFNVFMDQIVLPNCLTQPSLLCHSMGGAIGALMILTYPKVFAKVAFSAPMFGIKPALPSWLASFLIRCHFTFNKQVAYFAGQLNYVNHDFADNDLTQSEIRYQIFRQEYEDLPQLKLGGVTGNWLKAAMQAMDDIERQAQTFPIPALVVQAGADTVVDNKRQRRVVDKMPKVNFKIIVGAKHELLEEKDSFRQPCLHAVLDFFSAK
ncbi:alpha/beta fold hydrolase [Paraglaciecola sp.]|uniref:alpha/beta fold hydrolase n=1 Tax=Paraglaciecola sp. TaxID=1920173 RepID=UPI0030F44F7E